MTPPATAEGGTVERGLRGESEPPKLRGCRCQCAGCGEYFSSEGAFDCHRVGDFAEPGRWCGARRCMTLDEMLAAGFVRNKQGFLMKPDRRRCGAEANAGTCTLTAPTLLPRADAPVEAAW